MKIKQTKVTVGEREALYSTAKNICLSRNVKKHPDVKQHAFDFLQNVPIKTVTS